MGRPRLGEGTNGLLRPARMASRLARVECKWGLGPTFSSERQTAAVIARRHFSTRPSGSSWYYVLDAWNLNVFNLRTEPLLVQASLGYTPGQDKTGQQSLIAHNDRFTILTGLTRGLTDRTGLTRGLTDRTDLTRGLTDRTGTFDRWAREVW